MEPNEKKPYNDGIETIFPTLQKEYEGEENRNKHLETKVQVLLAVSGVLASALMLLLKAIVDSAGPKATILIILSHSFLFLIAAIISFLLAFRIKTFKQIAHNALLSDKAFQMDKQEVMYNLSHDYYECIKYNAEAAGSKVRLIKFGSVLMIISIIFLVIAFGHISYNIINKERSNFMAKDNENKTGNTGSNQTGTNSEHSESVIRGGRVYDSERGGYNKGPGFGTQPLEKSESGLKEK
ncbi:hypothetical protein Gbem_1909 [Citrifermentans bemidjiense Bem]|uniref:Pycsar effector protein domain-containing protein n=1 Tax=Citrifermentans bemidjiense (strain ATCC BAA-1014 / DSM 16622 / JCM 12645 / Bem) TaxID=404380 RepID=B5EB62_CITBB|nr:hypothetical protein [Citrifermentans bemidjiense]ACH38923.1 hypothetical protein Gbem_1909 [Citrifermentans bemidjiense Bem]